MSDFDEIDPDDLRPMPPEVQLAAFVNALWALVARFQGQEFELSDPHIIYAFEDVKQRMLEEMDLGNEMLGSDDDENIF